MMRRLRGGGLGVDVIGRSRTWLLVSGTLMLVALASLGVRGLNLGLEFEGGTKFEVQAERDATVSDVQDALAEIGVTQPVVQRTGEDGFIVQTAHLTAEEREEAGEAIAEVVGAEVPEVSVQDVGPKWGAQITGAAVRALLIFLVVAAVFISLRLEPKMAGVALVTLFHDILATGGIYSLTGFTVTPETVIAFLTILGYSLYDTVVIFDRVKEQADRLSAAGSRTYSQMTNEAVNQVLVRSLNTSITSLLPVGSLLFVGSFLLGASTLRELALALFIGLAAGTYSSIFVAAPLLAAWKEREDRWAALRARVAARGGEPGGTPQETAAASSRGGRRRKGRRR